jgi:hypothetical protein
MIRPAGPVAEEDQVTGHNMASTLGTEGLDLVTRAAP